MGLSLQEDEWAIFIGPWGTINFHLPLQEAGTKGINQMRDSKHLTLFFDGGEGGKGQSLLKFICFLQVKFIFSTEIFFFFFRISWHQKCIDL